ncbi:winged helix-turn-helix domain-containing protein [Archaeoglobus profundus]|uniref:Transcriptional regulator, ArsR family n=1 Tax=Archaeoglobus profundus (strain DSM 5631 / JCM 9629 / NBRC 100127 / Av18) TaxID=572546 RepID=D2RDD6_ARCPA|nr:winged helix-turn-helix domain-containing protein [Archaeoglobus profundus]ADB58130.1 transcriptional regulator, ArsR family [Archaeoglobus profundus DSM 5631]
MNTALRILKALQERNKTLSELSREVGVTKPSLLYHLSKLSGKGLVKKVQNGNKFVYYSLTGKGKNFVRLFTSLVSSALLSYVLVSLSKKASDLSASISTTYPVLQKGHTATVNVCIAFILAFVFLFTIFYFALLLLKR